MKKVAERWLNAMYSIFVAELIVFIWFSFDAKQRITPFVITLSIATCTCIYCGYKANKQYDSFD